MCLFVCLLSFHDFTFLFSLELKLKLELELKCVFVCVFMKQAYGFAPSNRHHVAYNTNSNSNALQESPNDIDNGPPYSGPAYKPLLDSISSPADMKRLDVKQLNQLAHELRWEVLENVSKTGGHLSSSLGVVEMTVALHYVFDMPEDDIVWDVSHQCYPHKVR